MIEDLAIWLVLQDEGTLQLIHFGLFIAGAILAVILRQSEAEITRAPYFSCFGLILFAISAVQVIWLFLLSAMTGRYVWVLLAISYTASAAGGYLFCLIALARSRDAYGHGQLAVLGFIPIANFWLLLTPSKNKASTNRLAMPPLLSGGLGVFTGLVFLAAGSGVTAYIESQARTMGQQSQTEPSADLVWIDSMIRTQGLEEALRLMAAEAPTPVAIDEVTTLSRIEATATQLQRTYVIELDDMTITEEFRKSHPKQYLRVASV